MANANSNVLNVGSLEEGIYQYISQTTLGGAVYNTSGEFLVKRIQLENLDLTANHQLLRDVATQTGGTFYGNDQIPSVAGDLDAMELKSIIRTNRDFFPLINIMWIMVILMTMLTIEWGMRKYLGSY